MNDQERLRVVYLEEDPGDAELVLQKLRQAGVVVLPERVDSEAAFLTALDVAPDLILADYRVAEFGAVGALRALAARALDVPLIVVSSTVGEEGAVECLREGATEYFLRDHLGLLGQAVCNAVAQARLRSERRRMAEALRASEERYRVLFDESPYLMWVTEIDTLRFLEVNRKAVSHYGYGRHEFLRMTLLDIQQPEESLGPREGARAVRAGEPRVSRHRHQTQSGELLEVSVTSRPVEFAGSSALLAVIEDVSERHRREAKLRQAQRMEAVGQLAGGVAHDFNNLLTIILGYAGLVAARLGDRPDLRRQVEEISRAGERSAALTRQLLAFSRQLPLQPRIVDLNAVVAGVETMLRRLIGEEVELTMRCAPDAGRVLVDPGLIEQVIVNLALNARDAMPAGGALVIETAAVDSDPSAAAPESGGLPGPQVLLSVSDRGCGMGAATRARIFEPFFTTKGPGKGTGLGLATVFGIVQQSNGRIEVQSELGSGSTFRIYLPRVAGAARIAESASPPGAERLGGSETVLVLEDEPALRQLVRTVLESGGYTVLSAETVAATLAVADRYVGDIHLLLTDIVMPGQSGPEAATYLLAQRPATRVLYMSGSSRNLIDRRSPLPPGVAILVKPFTERSLLRSVREVLDSAPAAAAATHTA